MFNLWQKPRERFSLEELKHLNDLLQKHAVITDSNKDSIVETLRSIAELMIWGDQHEPAFFEFFVEHGLFAHIVHILSVANKSSSSGVTVQLLQTLNIMLQNIKSDKAIFYLFSKEYINNVITFPFDFSDEELLAYYISFLKVISMKLDKSTITYFLVEKPDGSLGFPLYVEAIRFFHHEESMVRIAVRTISLTVYHVQDERVKKFVLSNAAIRYFEDLAIFIRQQSLTLARLVSNAARNFASVVDVGRVEGSIAEIGDLLYYCNDVMNAGIPELSEVMSEHLASIWLFPILLTSLAAEEETDSPNAKRVSPLCAMYLLSRVFHVITYRPFVEAAIRALVASVGPVRAIGPGQPSDAEQEGGEELTLSQGTEDSGDRGQVTPAPAARDTPAADEASLGGLWRNLFGDSAAPSPPPPAPSPAPAPLPGKPHMQQNQQLQYQQMEEPVGKGAKWVQAEESLKASKSTSDALRREAAAAAAAAGAGMVGPYWTANDEAHNGLHHAGAAPGHLAFDPSASAWDTVISHLLCDKERWILAALCILCGLLHNQAVGEDLLDELGILPNHKRQRRMLVEALVDEKASEEDLKRILQHPSASDSSTSSSSSASPLETQTPSRAGGNSWFGATRAAPPSSPPLGCQVCGGAAPVSGEGAAGRGQDGAAPQEPGLASFWTADFSGKTCACRVQHQRIGDIYFSPGCRHPKRRRQVIDTLMMLFCRRPPPCPEALWHSAWLLRQLLPMNARLSPAQTQLLTHSYECARADMIVEMLDCWSDHLPGALDLEWRACAKALESATLTNDSALVLLPSLSTLLAEGDTSSAAYGERMRSVVKVFVVIQRMRCLLLGLPIPETLTFADPGPPPPDARLWRRGLSLKHPQEGEEVSFAVGDALPCRVAFERGKEKKVLLLVASWGSSGWILLAEGASSAAAAADAGAASRDKQGDPLLTSPATATALSNSSRGGDEDPSLLTATIRVVAPLAGSQPSCDPKHKRWLHLRIRSPQQPPGDAGTLSSRSPVGSRAQSKRLADGRWTLAFIDEQQCRRAQLAVMEEIYVQGNAVRNMLEPVLGLLPPFRLHRDRPLQA